MFDWVAAHFGPVPPLFGRRLRSFRRHRFVDPWVVTAQTRRRWNSPKLPAYGNQLARFSIAGAEVPVVKQQQRKVRSNEALGISWQVRIAHAGETMGHHDAARFCWYPSSPLQACTTNRPT